jgi:hypothetical protein
MSWNQDATKEMPMKTHDLPLNTWLVVAQDSSEGVTLVSRHLSQRDAEATRDKRNQGLPEPHYSTCIVVEPVAQRMGGRPAPTAWEP